MSANYRSLVTHCMKAISTYDANTTGPDSYIEAYLASSDPTTLTDSEHTFISEVFAGCVRFNSIIKVVIDGFYLADGQGCLRADSNMYSIVTYLTLFRIEELGMGHFKRFMATQDTRKIHKFLNFLLNDANLKTWILDEWCKLYDSSFVQTQVLSPLLRFEPELKEYIESLSDKLANKLKPQTTTKPVTGIKPFNLTNPKPRTLPTPEKIPTLKIYKPPPKTTYSTPAELDTILLTKEKNKQLAKKKLSDASRIQFSCANTEKSAKTKTILQQIIDEKVSQTSFLPPKPQPVPQTTSADSVPVKLNTAAILREGARIQRAEEEEIKKLASLEAGGRDDSEFVRWQEDMKQREITEKTAEIERKHLEGLLSHEEAKIAKQNFIKTTQQNTLLLKEKSERIMAAYFDQQEEQRREMRQLVETIALGHQNVKEAKQKLQEMKQQIVKQVAKESQELMARALEEAEEEMRRKTELIQQIRAMESIPVVTAKFVDLTKTSGVGLLSEMSVAELRERLALLKVAEQEEAEKRRNEIVASKQAKERLLHDTKLVISRHKAEQNRQATLREKQLQQTAKVYKEASSKELENLQQILENKRKERERLQEEATQRLSQPSTSRRTQKTNATSSGAAGGWETIEKSRSSSQKRSRQLASLTTAPVQRGSSQSPLITSFPRSVTTTRNTIT
ncbi:cilia- and flagella-associated protein 99-like [Dysidea avara]|uniref:cilia- and flagella-associated protein 99-like n=1 Tax=Dysidea avara TaxID=196820 RepID=UPI0033226F36